MSKKSKEDYRKKVNQRRTDLFNTLWGEDTIKEFSIWDFKKRNGFTSIPRVMPYICQVLDYLGDKGTPLSNTYLSLWFRNFGDGFIEIKSEKDLAFESGFLSNRAITTWKTRMKTIKNLGFIDSKQGVEGEYQYTILFDPFSILKKKEKNIPEHLINCIKARLVEVGDKW